MVLNTNSAPKYPHYVPRTPSSQNTAGQQHPRLPPSIPLEILRSQIFKRDDGLIEAFGQPIIPSSVKAPPLPILGVKLPDNLYEVKIVRQPSSDLQTASREPQTIELDSIRVTSKEEFLSLPAEIRVALLQQRTEGYNALIAALTPADIEQTLHQQSLENSSQTSLKLPSLPISPCLDPALLQTLSLSVRHHQNAKSQRDSVNNVQHQQQHQQQQQQQQQQYKSSLPAQPLLAAALPPPPSQRELQAIKQQQDRRKAAVELDDVSAPIPFPAPPPITSAGLTSARPTLVRPKVSHFHSPASLSQPTSDESYSDEDTAGYVPPSPNDSRAERHIEDCGETGQPADETSLQALLRPLQRPLRQQGRQIAGVSASDTTKKPLGQAISNALYAAKGIDNNCMEAASMKADGETDVCNKAVDSQYTGQMLDPDSIKRFVEAQIDKREAGGWSLGSIVKPTTAKIKKIHIKSFMLQTAVVPSVVPVNERGGSGSDDSVAVAPAPPAYTSREVKVWRLMADPEIVEYENFVSESEIQLLLAIGERVGYEPSKTSVGKAGSDRSAYASTQSPNRTSYTARLSSVSHSIITTIEKRIAHFLGVDRSHIEPMSLLRYHPGQQFKVHHDGFFRSHSVLIYLSDVEGGGTEFPTLGIVLPPKKGTAIHFTNCLPDGKSDMRTLHAGLPVISGVKYCIPIFINKKPMKSIEEAE